MTSGRIAHLQLRAEPCIPTTGRGRAGAGGAQLPFTEASQSSSVGNLPWDPFGFVTKPGPAVPHGDAMYLMREISGRAEPVTCPCQQGPAVAGFSGNAGQSAHGLLQTTVQPQQSKTRKQAQVQLASKPKRSALVRLRAPKLQCCSFIQNRRRSLEDHLWTPTPLRVEVASTELLACCCRGRPIGDAAASVPKGSQVLHSALDEAAGLAGQGGMVKLWMGVWGLRKRLGGRLPYEEVSVVASASYPRTVRHLQRFRTTRGT